MDEVTFPGDRYLRIYAVDSLLYLASQAALASMKHSRCTHTLKEAYSNNVKRLS